MFLLQKWRVAAFGVYGYMNFTKNGFKEHSKNFKPEDMQARIEGKNCVVTGANAGIGYATAEGLASRGATVYMVCRSKEKGETALSAIRSKTGNENVHLELCDLSSITEIKSFANRFSLKDKPVHVLVNNAGVLENNRLITSEGFELNFAVNVLGTYTITELMVPLLEKAAPDARVITVSSGGMYTAHLTDDLEFNSGSFDGMEQYARNKRVQVALTEKWSEMYKEKGIGFYSMHPGWAETPGVAKSMPSFNERFAGNLRTSEEGADTVLWLALQPKEKLVSGSFYFDRAEAPKHLKFAATAASHPSFTYLSNHPTIPNPNPSSYFSYPQPAVHHAEPAIYPPGIDPDADSGSHPSTHVGIENQIQTQYYVDPNAASVAWVTWQAGSLTYENGSLPSTSLNSSGDSYATSQPLVNNVTQSIPTQSKVIQPVRCVVCNIDCNSKDVFQKHISGKKHLRNLQNQHNPSAATLKRSCNTINKVSLPSQELEMKRQKLLNGGAAVDSVRVCTVCNIACNGQEAFNDHLSGKKHAAQARLVSLGVGQYFAAIKVQNNGFWTRGAKKPKVVQSAWCEVCKMNCNSNDVYVKHLQGKKHQKNLENLDKAKNSTSAPASLPAPAATKPIIGPTEKPVANNSNGVDVQKLQKRAATEEDLETKKQKVVESGAVAQAVRVCTICNVVCNSETVFTYHLAGQKHAAMVKKQAGARTETSAPMVSAT